MSGLRKKLALLFLVTSLFLTGCVENGGEETVSEGRSFEITDFDCHPVTDSQASCSSITEFEDIVITATAENIGDSEVEIPFEHLEGGGESHEMVRASVIRNRCPNLFDMEQSSVEIRKITPEEITEYSYPDGNFNPSGNSIVLEEGEELDFEWNLHLIEDEDLYTDFNCPLNLELVTEQEVTTTKEIEFSEDPGGSLNPAISSAGPLKLNLEAPSTWELGDREFPVTVYASDRGYGDVEGDVELLTTDPAADDNRISCEPYSEDITEMRMLRDGSGETVRRTFNCQQDGGGDRFNSFLTLSARYRYTYDVGELDINICREGDTC